MYQFPAVGNVIRWCKFAGGLRIFDVGHCAFLSKGLRIFAHRIIIVESIKKEREWIF